MDKELFKNSESLLTRRNLQKGLEKNWTSIENCALQDVCGLKKIDYDLSARSQALLERQIKIYVKQRKTLTIIIIYIFKSFHILQIIINIYKIQ